MKDRWMIRGVQFVNCNCAWGVSMPVWCKVDKWFL